MKAVYIILLSILASLMSCTNKPATAYDKAYDSQVIATECAIKMAEISAREYLQTHQIHQELIKELQNEKLTQH